MTNPSDGQAGPRPDADEPDTAGGRDGPTRRLHTVGPGGPGPRDAVRWEIEHYVAERTDQLIEAGWDPDEARRKARCSFARRYRARIETIEWRRWMMRWMGSAWRVVRGSLDDLTRTVRRSPGFTIGVVLTLALGIGANAAMFTMVDRLLLTPPPHVAAADELRIVQVDRGSSRQTTLTYPDFDDLRRHGGLAGAGAFSHPRRVTRGSGSQAEDLRARLASHDFFPLLGVEATRGRFFDAEDDRVGARGTAVISAEYWERAFGSDPEVIGRSLRLSGTPFIVIGVAPEGFTGVTLDPVDVWLPLEAGEWLLNGQDGWRTNRNWWWIVAVVRPAEGTNRDGLLAEATRIHQNARSAAFDRDYTDTSIAFAPLVSTRPNSGAEATSVVRWLTGVSLIVLLIACANVANLLLARGVRRRRETAVRLALGVSRRRLVAQRALEAVFLAALGGIVALAVAHWGGPWMQRVLLPEVYFPEGGVSPRVVVFAAVASGLAGLLAGAGPALQSTRAAGVSDELGDARRGSSGRRSRLRGGLAIAQTTLSVVLLVGAGLFVKSLAAVRDLDLGLDADRLVLAHLELTDEDIPAVERNRLYRRAADRLSALPQVRDAALASPTFRSARAIGLRVQGFDSLPDLPGGGPYYFAVSPGYASTMGLELLEGRALQESDGTGAAPVALVSRTMAETLWPRASALARCLLLDGEDGGCTTVVGVVEDAARNGLQDDPFMAYYVPLAQRDDRVQGIYLRASGDVEEARTAALRVLRDFGPEVRFARARTLRDILDPQARSWTLGATLFTVFGLLALVVAAVGLYSLLAFEVAERTRELGIRSALGARRSRLLRGVLIKGARLAVAGVALGLAVAWLGAPYLRDLLFEVSPRDPVVLLGVSLALTLTAAIASLLPGLRATRVDPAEALRAE